jgi:hypothetical protein
LEQNDQYNEERKQKQSWAKDVLGKHRQRKKHDFNLLASVKKNQNLTVASKSQTGMYQIASSLLRGIFVFSAGTFPMRSGESFADRSWKQLLTSKWSLVPFQLTNFTQSP